MKDRYQQAKRFEEFLEGVEANRDLWDQIYRRARIPEDVLERARSLPGQWHLLVMTEDWCGDAIHSVPYLARLAEEVPQLFMRVIGREDNPDLMDAHLTEGKRSIPVVMILDHDFREVGWWGARPQPFKVLFEKELKSLPEAERFARMRAWYARDRGQTVLRELVAMIPAGV